MDYAGWNARGVLHRRRGQRFTKLPLRCIAGISQSLRIVLVVHSQYSMAPVSGFRKSKLRGKKASLSNQRCRVHLLYVSFGVDYCLDTSVDKPSIRGCLTHHSSISRIRLVSNNTSFGSLTNFHKPFST